MMMRPCTPFIGEVRSSLKRRTRAVGSSRRGSPSKQCYGSYQIMGDQIMGNDDAAGEMVEHRQVPLMGSSACRVAIRAEGAERSGKA
jgi:hypothetical protein